MTWDSSPFFTTNFCDFLASTLLGIWGVYPGTSGNTQEVRLNGEDQWVISPTYECGILG